MRPALGYNTWNDLRCGNWTETDVRAVVDNFEKLGLIAAGYEYINLDDCWQISRDSQGRIVPDPAKFPSGMKALADYVHSKGLKFGLYTDRGTMTCGGRPGSKGYEKIDAEVYASWGVDYLKEDSCYASQVHDVAFMEYGAMRDALNATGRPIYFSLCGWNPWYAPVGATLGNSWRIAGDVNSYPDAIRAMEINEPLAKYAGPGAWNDPDMLVGSSAGTAARMSPAQSRTQFSVWAVMAAPLLIGTTLTQMSAWDLETYTNAEVLAIDQDPLGLQGTRGFQNSLAQVWGRKIQVGSGRGVAVALINNSPATLTVTCNSTCLATFGVPPNVILQARDVWAHAAAPPVNTSVGLSADVGPSGSSMLFVLSA